MKNNYIMFIIKKKRLLRPEKIFYLGKKDILCVEHHNKSIKTSSKMNEFYFIIVTFVSHN